MQFFFHIYLNLFLINLIIPEIRGINVAENVQPIKKLIPMKAIVYFEEHSRSSYVNQLFNDAGSSKLILCYAIVEFPQKPGMLSLKCGQHLKGSVKSYLFKEQKYAGGSSRKDT